MTFSNVKIKFIVSLVEDISYHLVKNAIVILEIQPGKTCALMYTQSIKLSQNV